MNSGDRGFGVRTALIVVGTGALLVVLLISSVMPAALADLPPRPPTPAPPAPKAPVSGGEIELDVRFSPTWPWSSFPWQSLRTVVEWQDAWGMWHDVTGWQGGLDDATIGETGTVVGKKVWWVASADLGRGPFRWLVFRGDEDQAAAVTDPFDLPSSDGQTVVVDVLLEP